MTEVFVIEYSDSDNSSSVEGVYATIKLAELAANAQAAQAIEDYDGDDELEIKRGRDGGPIRILLVGGDWTDETPYEEWTIHTVPLIETEADATAVV
jgi:hypothetical protein